MLRKGSASQFFSDPNTLMATPVLFDYEDCNRGCFGRTPEEVTLDLRAGYKLRIGDTNLDIGVDVFNVFNRQEPTSYHDYVELTTGIPDPDFMKVQSYAAPRFWRVSARWTF